MSTSDNMSATVVPPQAPALPASKDAGAIASLPGKRRYRSRRKREKGAGKSLASPSAVKILRQLRPGATLIQIAKGTGLDLATVSRTFNRKRRPTWDTMTRIASYLGVTLDQLQKAIS
ncbi:MAG TPA: helix-turn-helix transcriptional regulator [Phycisphaerae bacterium]|nr:helix-turn-helix transcriptional regulator [Phycisphaerae bacterium]